MTTNVSPMPIPTRNQGAAAEPLTSPRLGSGMAMVRDEIISKLSKLHIINLDDNLDDKIDEYFKRKSISADAASAADARDPSRPTDAARVAAAPEPSRPTDAARQTARDARDAAARDAAEKDIFEMDL